jgi:hypothetical protein
MVAWSDTMQGARHEYYARPGEAKGFEELLETATSNANHQTFARYEEIPT